MIPSRDATYILCYVIMTNQDRYMLDGCAFGLQNCHVVNDRESKFFMNHWRLMTFVDGSYNRSHVTSSKVGFPYRLRQKTTTSTLPTRRWVTATHCGCGSRVSTSRRHLLKFSTACYVSDICGTTTSSSGALSSVWTRSPKCFSTSSTPWFRILRETSVN